MDLVSSRVRKGLASNVDVNILMGHHQQQFEQHLELSYSNTMICTLTEEHSFPFWVDLLRMAQHVTDQANSNKYLPPIVFPKASSPSQNTLLTWRWNSKYWFPPSLSPSLPFTIKSVLNLKLAHHLHSVCFYCDFSLHNQKLMKLFIAKKTYWCKSVVMRTDFGIAALFQRHL